ncbi:MAG: DUF547 domain-containing protein [Burkholderiales bacterium]
MEKEAMGHSSHAGGRRKLLVGIALAPMLALWSTSALAAFDHGHAAWSALLMKHVVVAKDDKSSTVDYAAFKRDRPALQSYLESLSAVGGSEYKSWSKPEQLAFLINAYNAFTVELILTRFPDLKSIKDLGSFLSSPWKKEFFRLLGKERSLDEVEHQMIREPGVFNEPRIHFAVNCASIGCPMLKSEAFTPDRLEAQLADATTRFLSDPSRNRFQPPTGTLAVSKIFDWYHQDFEQGFKGIDSLAIFFARNAEQLANTKAGQENVRAGRYKLEFLDYDWALNDSR